MDFIAEIRRLKDECRQKFGEFGLTFTGNPCWADERGNLSAN